MKPNPLVFSALFTLMAACQATEKAPVSLALPLTTVAGYGPFDPGFGILQGEDPVGTQQDVTGIPAHWTNVKPHRVSLNYNQFVYQNFAAGKIDRAWFAGYCKHLKWAPTKKTFTRTPIRCYVYTLRGFDTRRGAWMVMVDTNNDLNFSDEIAFIPDVIRPTQLGQNTNVRLVQYDVYRAGRVQPARIPMVIKRYGDNFFYNFPEHYTAQLTRGGRTYNLLISSSGFTRPDFNGLNVTKSPTWFWQKKITQSQLAELGETLTFGDVTYRNKGVDPYRNALLLEPVDPAGRDYSLQEGHPFRPFAAREFSTNQPISLGDFRGKYVYVDFWGTWCKGCVEDMPMLKAIHSKLDRKRFAFVGIVGENTPRQLADFLQKHRITWPQILSDTANKLVEQYPLTGYPTTVLLNPDGMIIAKNLRGQALADKLAELNR